MAHADLDAARTLLACDAAIIELEALPPMVMRSGSAYDDAVSDPRQLALVPIRQIRALAMCAAAALAGSGRVTLSSDEVMLIASHFPTA
jgi:hypothetical protein